MHSTHHTQAHHARTHRRTRRARSCADAPQHASNTHTSCTQHIVQLPYTNDTSIIAYISIQLLRFYSTGGGGKCLVVADHNNSQLYPSFYNTITAAVKLGSVDVLVAGHQCEGVCLSPSLPSLPLALITCCNRLLKKCHQLRASPA